MKIEKSLETDERWMKRAIELAELGKGKVHPNPMVGAVIVKDGVLIGEGFHGYYGGPHGEIEALKDCEIKGNNPLGAEVYVTLEPCCHYGKTPPCTEALIKAGVKRVIVAVEDPNPLVKGKGIETLKKAGIAVVVGIMKDGALAQNKVFFHYMTHNRPYVILKSATSLDGKIATRLGESKWITSEATRAHSHDIRGRVGAIMVGIGTVLADDPLLTCRRTRPDDLPSTPSRQSVRIVIDSQLEIPLDCQLVQTAREVPLWVVCGQGVKPNFQRALTENGVRILEQNLDPEGHVDLKKLMSILGEHKIDSVLIEGGGSLNDSALRSDIVHEVNFYIAPILIGGSQAKTGVAGLGAGLLSEGVQLENMEVIPLGRDFLIKGTVKRETLTDKGLNDPGRKKELAIEGEADVYWHR